MKRKRTNDRRRIPCSVAAAGATSQKDMLEEDEKQGLDPARLTTAPSPETSTSPESCRNPWGTSNGCSSGRARSPSHEIDLLQGLQARDICRGHTCVIISCCRRYVAPESQKLAPATTTLQPLNPNFAIMQVRSNAGQEKQRTARVFGNLSDCCKIQKSGDWG